MKQLTVYDGIRTVHREVVRWQVREALEEYMRRMLVPVTVCDGNRAARIRWRTKRQQRLSHKRKRHRDAALAELKRNVTHAVLQLIGPERLNRRLRVVK